FAIGSGLVGQRSPFQAVDAVRSTLSLTISQKLYLSLGLPLERAGVKVPVEGQNILYLYGATTQPEVTGFVRTQCVVGDEAEIQRIVQDWKRAAQRFAAISSSPKVV